MALAEAILEIAADLEAEADATGGFVTPAVLAAYAKQLRRAVQAAEPPKLAEAAPVDFLKLVQVPAEVLAPFGPDWLKRQEEKARQAAAKRELRDKMDLGESCAREMQGHPMFRFDDGPLEGDTTMLPPSTPEGHEYIYTDGTGTVYRYKLCVDRKFRLVDGK